MSWVNQGSPSFIELHNSFLSKAVCGRHQVFFFFCLRIFFFISPTGKFFLKLLIFSFLSFDSKRFTVVRAVGLQIDRCKYCWFLTKNFFLQHTPGRPATQPHLMALRGRVCSGCHTEVWQPQRWCGAFTLSCPPPTRWFSALLFNHSGVLHSSAAIPLQLSCEENPSPFFTHRLTHSLTRSTQNFV